MKNFLRSLIWLFAHELGEKLQSEGTGREKRPQRKWVEGFPPLNALGFPAVGEDCLLIKDGWEFWTPPGFLL